MLIQSGNKSRWRFWFINLPVVRDLREEISFIPKKMGRSRIRLFYFIFTLYLVLSVLVFGLGSFVKLTFKTQNY